MWRDVYWIYVSMICCKKKNVETFEGRVGFGRDYVIFKFMRVYYLNDYFFPFVYFIICIAKRGDTSCRNEEREMQTIERNGIGKGYSRIYVENRNYVHIIILNTETYSSSNEKPIQCFYRISRKYKYKLVPGACLFP